MAGTTQLCAVTIGADHYLLPLKDGSRLLEILSKAVPMDRSYDHRGLPWRTCEAQAGRFELALVNPNDIDVTTTGRGPVLRRLALPGGR